MSTNRMTAPMGCLLACTLVLLALLAVGPEPTSAQPQTRPTRPKAFQSPAELKNYLDQMGNYFAVAGRPRFGKRSPFNILRTPDFADFRRDLSDLYDLYQQPDD